MSKERVATAMDELTQSLDEYVNELEQTAITGDGYGHLYPNEELLQALYASKLMSRLVEEAKCDVLGQERRSW